MLASHIGRVRLVGLAEGVSFLLLMFVAMPLKYFAGIPEAVLAVGWAHGALFVLYALVTLVATVAGEIGVGTMFLAAGAALVPGGPFLLDGRLKKQEMERGGRG